MLRFTHMIKRLFITVIIIGALAFVGSNLVGRDQVMDYPDRLSRISGEAVKMTVETDANPVRSYSDEYEQPIPLSGVINTAGAEDSAFVLPDGQTLYFFFTPDVQVPVEEQLLDEVTGIYRSDKFGGEWQEPERVQLQNKNKLSLDGCLFVLGDAAWFCTTREGYVGLHWATAQFEDGRWQDWDVNDFPEEYEVGELHMTQDGQTLFFHSSRLGGLGGLDLWVSEKMDGEWQEPVNLSSVNTERDEGWPALNLQEDELWISRDYALWRSQKVDGEWQEPEKMFGPLAGEASIDENGDVYFTHHYFEGDVMVEADIYVAKKSLE